MCVSPLDDEVRGAEAVARAWSVPPLRARWERLQRAPHPISRSWELRCPPLHRGSWGARHAPVGLEVPVTPPWDLRCRLYRRQEAETPSELPGSLKVFENVSSDAKPNAAAVRAEVHFLPTRADAFASIQCHLFPVP